MLTAVRRAAATIAARRARSASRGSVTFDEATSQVCDNRCRAAAQYDRNRTAAIYGAF
ncbi:hypothetical protein [Yinghuangia sp. YIM S09857]|uniref:hypothetical protein n=1 Tax=Yinghuangia sp. YIM S09857 TaxID=3436929 RepID=UPI003F534EA1